ncbi:MAG TPA: hypothetical protein VHF25_08355 [Nitriliruptorales bacterium]|nr:hypothetical protein [Nitriliruptorales bacterium]
MTRPYTPDPLARWECCVRGVEVLSAIVYDHTTADERTGRVDPAVYLRGELPATARPFGVERMYRGPQGHYDESFAIVAPDGEVVYQHPYARITLRGEMFEDRYRDVVDEPVTFRSADEHTLVILLGEVPVARVPVFVEAPESAQAAGVVGDALAATLKKSAIIWLTIPQPGGGSVTKPAWFVYQDGKVFVLTGPGEQDLTNIAQAEEVLVTTRSAEVRAQVGRIPATVRVVDPDDETFTRIARLGIGTRLNMRDGEAAMDRWRTTCTMVELTPQV